MLVLLTQERAKLVIVHAAHPTAAAALADRPLFITTTLHFTAVSKAARKLLYSTFRILTSTSN